MEKQVSLQENFSEWYLQVINAAELVDYGPVRGTMVIRPYGYALWEQMQRVLDMRFKALGVQNAYFPLFIPQSFITKEAKHVEGFAPELAIVTHAGGKELEEPLVVRPTSETVIYYMFSKWIKSWRDLPMKVNQWANVVRWEMRTRPFIRTTEFLWQEGHTAHATAAEAIEMAQTIHKTYIEFITDYLAIPVVAGLKSANETFAGADRTYTMEAMMQDGRALQMGTSHVLSQTFSSAFDIQFQDQDGKIQSPYCSSWGVTTRLIGATIMVHGDDAGLVLPPKIAPWQVVIVPIYRKDDEKQAVLAKAQELSEQLTAAGIRVQVDADDQKTPGAKFFYWEARGVPLRLEIGPKDIEKGQAVLVARVRAEGADKKLFVSLNELTVVVVAQLKSLQSLLLKRAQERLESRWTLAARLEQFGPDLDANNGFFQTGWCQQAACEEKLKEAYKATIRVLLPDKVHTVCFNCGKESTAEVIVAKAY